MTAYGMLFDPDLESDNEDSLPMAPAVGSVCCEDSLTVSIPGMDIPMESFRAEDNEAAKRSHSEETARTEPEACVQTQPLDASICSTIAGNDSIDEEPSSGCTFSLVATPVPAEPKAKSEKPTAVAAWKSFFGKKKKSPGGNAAGGGKPNASDLTSLLKPLSSKMQKCVRHAHAEDVRLEHVGWTKSTHTMDREVMLSIGSSSISLSVAPVEEVDCPPASQAMPLAMLPRSDGQTSQLQFDVVAHSDVQQTGTTGSAVDSVAHVLKCYEEHEDQCRRLTHTPFSTDRVRLGDVSGLCEPLRFAIGSLPRVDSLSESQKRALWTDVYRPELPSHLVDNHETVAKVTAWLQDWTYRLDTGKVLISEDAGLDDDVHEGLQCMLLIGEPASAKSLISRCLCNQFGYEVLESFPGQNRSGKELYNMILEATQSQSVAKGSTNVPSPVPPTLPKGGKRKKRRKNTTSEAASVSSDDKSDMSRTAMSISKRCLIMIDEVDNVWADEHDRGFDTALENLVRITRRPILLTANRYPSVCSNIPLRTVHTSRPDAFHVAAFLRAVALAHGCELDARDAFAAAEYCRCDIRRLLLQMQWCIGASHTLRQPLLESMCYDRIDAPGSLPRHHALLKAVPDAETVVEAVFLNAPCDDTSSELEVLDDISRIANSISLLDCMYGASCMSQQDEDADGELEHRTSSLRHSYTADALTSAIVRDVSVGIRRCIDARHSSSTTPSDGDLSIHIGAFPRPWPWDCIPDHVQATSSAPSKLFDSELESEGGSCGSPGGGSSADFATSPPPALARPAVDTAVEESAATATAAPVVPSTAGMEEKLDSRSWMAAKGGYAFSHGSLDWHRLRPCPFITASSVRLPNPRFQDAMCEIRALATDAVSRVLPPLATVTSTAMYAEYIPFLSTMMRLESVREAVGGPGRTGRRGRRTRKFTHYFANTRVRLPEDVDVLNFVGDFSTSCGS